MADTTAHRPHVVVVGAGIIGLTTALSLAATRLYTVTVVTRDTDATAVDDKRVYTSAGSGGFWMPFHCDPEALVRGWAASTLDVLTAEAHSPDSGVNIFPGVLLHPQAPAAVPPPPWWAALPTLSFATVDADHPRVPPGYEGGYYFESPIAEMDVYLPVLRARAAAAGVRLFVLGEDLVAGDAPSLLTAVRAVLTTLSSESGDGGTCDRCECVAALAPPSVIVNCTGLGAVALVGDTTLTPARGVTVVVEPSSPVSGFVSETPTGDGRELAYILNRGPKRLTVGGTYHEGDWSRSAPAVEVKALLDRAAAVVPAVTGAKVLRQWVGLRPARAAGIRLESEWVPPAGGTGDARDQGGVVVHNYGHGGGGVTVCWGCAKEAVRLVGAALPDVVVAE
ncbi:hypothetical protein I4F81_010874 [Pyropia yezoensis]|uniref:Uncharacterized protein n=1 Tax=Pyropia yezoensis TaxID=2788 RepID=A0ACC3CEM6_PYRYE|nr:hypothetical protein I4F81_010874 [Neopyropia yezoensis]|eukprot:contig_12104_g2893